MTLLEQFVELEESKPDKGFDKKVVVMFYDEEVCDYNYKYFDKEKKVIDITININITIPNYKFLVKESFYKFENMIDHKNRTIDTILFKMDHRNTWFFDWIKSKLYYKKLKFKKKEYFIKHLSLDAEENFSRKTLTEEIAGVDKNKLAKTIFDFVEKEKIFNSYYLAKDFPFKTFRVIVDDNNNITFEKNPSEKLLPNILDPKQLDFNLFKGKNLSGKIVNGNKILCYIPWVADEYKIKRMGYDVIFHELYHAFDVRKMKKEVFDIVKEAGKESGLTDLLNKYYEGSPTSWYDKFVKEGLASGKSIEDIFRDKKFRFHIRDFLYNLYYKYDKEERHARQFSKDLFLDQEINDIMNNSRRILYMIKKNYYPDTKLKNIFKGLFSKFVTFGRNKISEKSLNESYNNIFEEENYYAGIGRIIKSPQEAAQLEKSKNYIAEIKHDGFWCSVKLPEIVFTSRNGQNKNKLAAIQYLIQHNPKLKKLNVILIGEMVTTEKKFYVFDIVEYNGKKVNQLKFNARRKILEKLKIYSNDIILSKIYNKNFLELFHTITDEGGEGLVLKKTDYIYNPGEKSKDVYKFKAKNTMDYVVTGYEMSDAKSYNGMIKSIKIGLFKKGELVDIGYVGNMTVEIRKRISENPHFFLNKVVEVGGFKIYNNGTIRHPYFIKFRDDKTPSECILQEDQDNTKSYKPKQMHFDRNEALKLAQPVLHKLKDYTIAGSYRREKEKIADLDIISYPTNIDELKKEFDSILMQGNKKISGLKDGLQIDIYFTNKESFPYMLFYLTGPVWYNIRVRNKAKTMGYKLTSEYMTNSSGQKVKANSEIDIQDELGLKRRNPKERESNSDLTLIPKFLHSVVSESDMDRFKREKQFPRTTPNFFRFRVKDPKLFDPNTFRLINKNDVKLHSGDKIVVGKLKDTGKWTEQSYMINKKNLEKYE